LTLAPIGGAFLLKKTKIIVFVGIYVALAVVLDLLKEYLVFLDMPSGGSINIALIPIVIASFHLGAIKGMIVGLLWWLVSSMLGLNPYYVSFGQYLFDYIIPSILPGLASCIYKKDNMWTLEAGIALVMTLRTLSIVYSGAIYWPDGVASGSLEAWVASCSYNLPYCLLTMAMLLIVVPIIVFRHLKNVIR